MDGPYGTYNPSQLAIAGENLKRNDNGVVAAVGEAVSGIGVSGSSVGVCVLALGVIGVLGVGDDIETGESSS